MENNYCWVNYKQKLLFTEPNSHIREKVNVVLDLYNQQIIRTCYKRWYI